jgi:hypothetical protein
VKPTSRLSRSALPQPHARPAAVLGDELDADARRSGASDIPSKQQQPKKQQQKIQENKCSEKTNSQPNL